VDAQVDFVPFSLRDIKLEKSDVSWCDIGGISPPTSRLEMSNVQLLGLNETKRIIRETLEWPTKYGPIFKQAPLRLRSG
jgi:peroxin-1